MALDSGVRDSWSQHRTITSLLIYKFHNSLWALIKFRHTHTTHTEFYLLPFYWGKPGQRMLKELLELTKLRFEPSTRRLWSREGGGPHGGLTVHPWLMFWSRKWYPATLRRRNKLEIRGGSRRPRVGPRDPDVQWWYKYLVALTTTLMS